MTTIGILHPGQMGVTIAAQADAETLWAGSGRSSASAARANSAGITNVGDVATLCERSEIVISICPPAAAEDIADQVAGSGFEGTYVDANAIAPATSLRIRDRFERYIDGGVIGPPATTRGTTRMYLAGPGATELATLWSAGALDAVAIGESADTAAASALKMAYAGWTKGQSALLLAVNALAEHAGVLDVLRQEWDISQPGLVERSQRVGAAAGGKAWRFAGEMAEISDAMGSAGLPSGFHAAAGELYATLADFKDVNGPPLDQILSTLLEAVPQQMPTPHDA